jgi:hypothetical protein
MHVRRSIYPIMPLFAPSLGSHHVLHHASASVPLTEIERRLSVLRGVSHVSNAIRLASIVFTRSMRLGVVCGAVAGVVP